MIQPPPKTVSAKSRWTLKRLGELLSIFLMLTGVIMVCQPFAHVLFQWGFPVTLAGIVCFTIASNLPERKSDDA